MVSNIPPPPCVVCTRSSQITDALIVPASSLAARIGEVDGVSEQHSVIIHLGHRPSSFKHPSQTLTRED